MVTIMGCRKAQYIDEIKTIDVNGVSILYQVRGWNNKPAIILIHGNGGSHELLGLMAQQLDSAGYLVYAPDSRGQGANEPVTEYHYADMAEDMAQMIGQLGIKNPYVFGWSDGGIIALMTEMAHPGIFRAIITSGANIYPEGVYGLGPDSIDQLREEYKDVPLFRMMLYEPNIRPEELEAIHCPALIVAGEKDIIRMDHTRLIAESIPQGEMMILPGEDHISHILNNPKMGEIIIKYLDQLNQ